MRNQWRRVTIAVRLNERLAFWRIHRGEIGELQSGATHRFALYSSSGVSGVLVVVVIVVVLIVVVVVIIVIVVLIVVAVVVVVVVLAVVVVVVVVVAVVYIYLVEKQHRGTLSTRKEVISHSLVRTQLQHCFVLSTGLTDN